MTSEYVDRQRDQRPTPTILTSKSAAIAGFTFAVFSMLGQGTWSYALQAVFWGASFPQRDVLQVIVGWAIASLMLAAAGLVLARRALRFPLSDEAWEGHLARAAVIVAGVGVLVSLVGIIGGLLRYTV